MKNSKHSVFTVIFCLLSFALTFMAIPGTSVFAKEPIVLKIVSFHKQGLSTKGVELYINKVNEAAKGELKIEWMGGPEAIPSHDQPEAVRNGTVELGFVPPGYYKSQLPEASSLFFSDLYPWEERANGFYDLMVDLHKKAGWRYIGVTLWGPMYNIFTTFKVENPKDLEGHLLRSGKTSLAFCKAIGAKPVTLPLSDLYSSLDRGLVEGYFTNAIATLDLKLEEVVKYGIHHGIYNDKPGVLMNLNSWNKLPKHLQDLMIQSLVEVERDIVNYYEKEIDVAWQTVQKKGVKVVKFTPEQAKKFTGLANEIGWKAVAKRMDQNNRNKIEKLIFNK